jgi:hypothetical protein
MWIGLFLLDEGNANTDWEFANALTGVIITDGFKTSTCKFRKKLSKIQK